ncbi:AraC family transcriptional regulator [Coraliomargarita sp. SDUM461004]|uniref:AraC family transcriptional regulator n=1 Tax=Thalassobacterium sedimentorum TaxID=3041258 RepID=A0ABU1AJP0_9BACT|nr:AraC family transcriptional regulator [Coraliomargarita sp. SDUM461004]MDQ8195041.1 AraC family transcriptional regulator [Coraliomargarita sp. SDUM461004]
MTSSINHCSYSSIEVVDRPWFPYLCTEVEHWEWRTSGDGHYNFWMALSGEGYLRCETQTFRIFPGAFFIFSPKQNISAAHYSGPRITRFSAHFHPLCNGERTSQITDLPQLGGQVQSLSQAQRQIDVIMRIALRRDNDTVLAHKLYNFIAQCTGQNHVNTEAALNERVSEALRIFREAPASVESIAQIAQQLGVSRSHFDREFTRQTGQAPKHFLINCKMIEARRYLESSHLRVGEIAEALGYKDIYFFSRQFKQLVGKSPLQYRKELQ